MNSQTKNNKSLCGFKRPQNLKHLAVIMDGNGRWAKKKGWPRYFGHFRGVKALRQIVRNCSKIGIPYLTVFAFSTENWKRPSIEISVIMKLMKRTLFKYQEELNRLQISLRVLGDLSALKPSVQDIFKEMIEKTKKNSGMQLIIAVNYGGRREILQAVNTILKDPKFSKKNKINHLSEDDFNDYLSSSLYPPPDMIIRTGGVSRLSNFYLWSAAYSELYISSLLWPDFDDNELKKALEFYVKTSRRFGAILKESKKNEY